MAGRARPSSRGEMLIGRSVGIWIVWKKRMPSYARPTPTIAPISASSMLSVSNWRTSRPRAAPHGLLVPFAHPAPHLTSKRFGAFPNRNFADATQLVPQIQATLYKSLARSARQFSCEQRRKHRQAVIIDMFADQIDSTRSRDDEAFTRHLVHDNIHL